MRLFGLDALVTNGQRALTGESRWGECRCRGTILICMAVGKEVSSEDGTVDVPGISYAAIMPILPMTQEDLSASLRWLSRGDNHLKG
jgi:hypothetical protein